ANVAVTVSVAGVHGSGLNYNFDVGICWGVSDFNGGIPLVELAANLGNHCVASYETDDGVGWVQGVRTGEVRLCVLLSSHCPALRVYLYHQPLLTQQQLLWQQLYDMSSSN